MHMLMPCPRALFCMFLLHDIVVCVPCVHIAAVYVCVAAVLVCVVVVVVVVVVSVRWQLLHTGRIDRRDPT